MEISYATRAAREGNSDLDAYAVYVDEVRSNDDGKLVTQRVHRVPGHFTHKEFSARRFEPAYWLALKEQGAEVQPVEISAEADSTPKRGPGRPPKGN